MNYKKNKKFISAYEKRILKKIYESKSDEDLAMIIDKVYSDGFSDGAND